MPKSEVPQHTEVGDARLEAITEVALTSPGVRTGKMFGRPGLRNAAGKFFVFQYGDDLVFKLTGDAETEALALTGAALFEPMAGRVMNHWVVVPAEQSASDAQWVLTAAEQLDQG